MKKFVIDTSVLLYDPECLTKFSDNQVIIPSIVLEEINKFKEEKSERGFCAREVSKTLEKLSVESALIDGVKLGDTVIKTSYACTNQVMAGLFTMRENDYQIIACAKNNDAILISRDRMMRVLARDQKIKTEEYKADKVKATELYKGYRTQIVTGEYLDDLFSKGQLPNEFGLFPNEFIILRDDSNVNHVGVGILKNGLILPCNFEKMFQRAGFNMKLIPMNLEQKMFVYLLLDKDITCVTCMGVSGKGKSLLSIDYALSSVQASLYHKFLYTKSVIAVDEREELGFYKGGIEDKLKPHVQPLYNSIEFLYKDELYGQKKKPPNIKKPKRTDDDDNNGEDEKLTIDKLVDSLRSNDILNLYPLANIRGMSIFEQVVMLDEAQNTTNHMIKSLVTRCNDTSKLIVVGDVEQIDDKNLNKYNNGLTHLVEAGKTEEFIGHISMEIDTKSQRGKLSAFGSQKL